MYMIHSRSYVSILYTLTTAFIAIVVGLQQSY